MELSSKELKQPDNVFQRLKWFVGGITYSYTISIYITKSQLLFVRLSVAREG